MASYPNVAVKENASSFLAQPLVFQRGEASVRSKKALRKTPCRLQHIVILFLSLAGIFFVFSKAYLFLVSWDKLMIRTVEIVSSRPDLKTNLERAFRGSRPGNILLCDIERLRTQIRSFTWVKEARIRKIFPSTLRIEITERMPKALLRRFDLTLIDEEGVELVRSVPEQTFDLPVLIDRGGFRKDYQERLRSAWTCLAGIPSPDRDRVASLDMTDGGTVVLRFKDDPVFLKLTDRGVSEKFQRYLSHKRSWESRFGALEYVDLRFDDRIYIKSTGPTDAEAHPETPKEAE